MHATTTAGGVLTILCRGELSRAELVHIADQADEARRGGREVTLDFRRVEHLHVGGADRFARIPGLRIVVASRYVKDLLRAGGVLDVEEEVPRG